MNRYTVLTQNEAIEEAREIYEQYESVQKRLGDKFIESLERAITSLSYEAFYYQVLDKRKIYRRILLDRFPCMVIYEIEENIVYVLSIRFERENPAKQQKFRN